MEIIDDDLLENILLEDFNLELRFDPFRPTPSAVMLDPGVATVYVQDNDGKKWGFVIFSITYVATLSYK